MSAARSGYSSTEMNFADATQDSDRLHAAYDWRWRTSEHPSQWGVLGKASPSGMSYGVFVGYNVQFSDVIVGIDLHYNRSNFSANAPVTPITRGVSAGGNSYNVTVDGAASMQHHRLWLGARFAPAGSSTTSLPYATVGFARRPRRHHALRARLWYGESAAV